jgi:hypothetical protein
MILLLILRGRYRHWHERWIDYRTLAERLRLSRCLLLFGGGGQQVSLAEHLASYGNPAATWMHWQYRAVERAAGLPNAKFSEDYLHGCRTYWIERLIAGQIGYHESNRKKYQRMESCLNGAVAVLLVAAVGVCVWELTHGGSHEWPLLLSAFLPALGAAIAGVRSQAEAQRLARRSIAMNRSLERMKSILAEAPARSGEGNSQAIRIVVDRVAELMAREMLDWRVILADRPLEVHF